ncbi:S9 family peptidase [bacterium]|nr:S9 family peptidase [bacterium]
MIFLLLSLPVWCRPITHADLYQFQWIGDIQISPTGDQVAFVRVRVDDTRNSYETSLWLASTRNLEAPRQLTSGPKDRSPRWSPDGQKLAFVRGKLGKLAVQPLDQPECKILTQLPRSVSSPLWAPDGHRLAFLCDANSNDFSKKEVSDVSVIKRAMYRLNGSGLLDPTHPRQLWTQDLEGGPPRQLTRGSYSVEDPHFSPDGNRLIFAADRRPEPYYDPAQTEILEVSLQEKTTKVLQTLPLDIWDLCLSPDGQKLAFHAEAPGPVRSYVQPDLWLLDLKQSRPRNLTSEYDFDMGSGVAGDNGPPAGGGGGGIQWHGDRLLDTVARQGKAALVSVDTGNGKVTELTHGEQAVQAYSRALDGTIVTKVSTPTLLNEIFRLDGQPVTQLNRELFEPFALRQPEEINYTSFDGRKIQAWLQKPPDFDPAQKYPLILNIHGGPHAAYGWVFDHEFQAAAARGYLVLYPNPRGSTSYGQEFGNLIQHRYPGDDYLDLMAGVDTVLARGYVDPKKLAVTGGSGGGLLTNWTVSHTHRFQAAVAQRDISDWASWWYTTDMALFRPSWFKSPPFEDPTEYARRSPITYVKEITTPMMFLVGDKDTRTPPESGGEQLFRALKYLKRPTVLVRFPRESHDLSRSGEPHHRVERLDHILGWFDKWILGLPRPEYDL